MKKWTYILLGFVVGVVLTASVFCIVCYCKHHRDTVPVQYFDVNIGKGDVRLHTFMPKDSVYMLLGKPSSVNVQTTDGIAIEEAIYNVGGFGLRRIRFVEGELIDAMSSKLGEEFPEKKPE